MVPLFDIFKLQKDRSLRWCEAADTLEAARIRVAALGELSPAEYVIFNQQTGQRVVIEVGGLMPQPQTSTPQLAHRRATLHICRVDNEKLRWVEQVGDLHSAETRIKQLKSSHPGDYLVLDYDPQEDVTPPWMPLTCVLANYLISSVALGYVST
jgi:hypothetical protein